jgi:hypothetical protein
MKKRSTKQTRPSQWPDNPAVAEVRRARAALLKEAGNDINALFDLVKNEGARRSAAEGSRKTRRRSA